jgi:hypothetical protein
MSTEKSAWHQESGTRRKTDDRMLERCEGLSLSFAVQGCDVTWDPKAKMERR